MTIIISEGRLKGHIIRKARKTYRCDEFLADVNKGRCPNKIKPGQYYVLGSPGARSGGYGVNRICFECASPITDVVTAMVEAGSKGDE